MEKAYIGDGVYVEEGSFKGEVVLTTSNGMQDTNTIVLEPSVVKALSKWLEQSEEEDSVYG